MTFSIIGTGNLAWFFGSRLVAGKHHCAGVYARDIQAAEKLAVALLSDKFGTIAEVSDDEADVCFLAVSDSAIGEVVSGLSFSNTVLVHTAGAVSIDALEPAAKERGVVWPVYSIVKNSLPAHRQIPCAWEASTDRAQRLLLTMCHAITDELFEAKYEQRKWLHLSAVMSNNFINHLLAVCEQVCADNKLPFSILMPIIEQTFERSRHTSPQKLQTGPAARHDGTTIQKQLTLLAKHPEWQKIYEAMTASIQAMQAKNA